MQPDLISLTDPPHSIFFQPNPIIYFSHIENKEYIIFTPNCSDSKKCIKYDIENDKYIELTESPPKTFQTLLHSHCVDDYNHKLYVFGGSKSIFGIYDLLQNTWDVKCETNKQNNNCKMIDGFNASPSLFLTHPINQLHSFMKTTHIIYNPSDNAIMQIDTKIIPPLQYPGMVYISGHLLIFGGQLRNTGASTQIWACNALNNECNEFEWKLCKLELPIPMKFRWHCRHIVAFENVLILFNFEKSDFWYCDFGGSFDANNESNDYDWISGKVPSFKENSRNVFAILTKSNWIHFAHIYTSDTVFHCKVPLSTVIGSDVCHRYSDTLVFGYIHRFEKENEIIMFDIPKDIHKLILCFYV